MALRTAPHCPHSIASQRIASSLTKCKKNTCSSVRASHRNATQRIASHRILVPYLCTSPALFWPKSCCTHVTPAAKLNFKFKVQKHNGPTLNGFPLWPQLNAAKWLSAQPIGSINKSKSSTARHWSIYRNLYMYISVYVSKSLLVKLS